MDVSDGLVKDLGCMARASRVGFDIDTATLGCDLAPIRDIARVVGVDALRWVLGGGEDHALVGTCRPAAVPAGFRVIGTVTAAAGTVAVDGAPYAGEAGWEHF